MNHQSSSKIPTNISLEKWSDLGFVWQGQLPIVELDRLCEHLNLDNKTATLALQVHLTANKPLKLTYQVQGLVQSVCQRCVSPLEVDLSGEYALFLLSNEGQIAQLDPEQDDFVLLDEVCPDGKKMLHIKDLLEDELILSLPLSLHHDACQADIESIEEDEPKENPFAILAQLKRS